jgi:PEP-CTERM motif-containing protein
MFRPPACLRDYLKAAVRSGTPLSRGGVVASKLHQLRLMKKTRAFSPLRSAIAALGLFTLTASAQAQLTLDSYDRGHYDSAGNHNASDVNYLAGDFGPEIYRSFFVFNLSCIEGDITTAKLRINNPFSSSPDANESVTISSVGVSIPTLLAGGSGTSIYSALDDSPNFISSTQLNPNTTGFLEFALNSSFINYAETNFGGFIALSLRVTSIQPNSPDEFFFGNTGNSLASDVQLVLDGTFLAVGCPLPLPTDANVPVPEPSTYGLMGAGLLVAAVALRRRFTAKRAA